MCSNILSHNKHFGQTWTHSLSLSLSLLLDFFPFLFWLKFHFSGAYGGLDLTAVRFESNGSWRFQIPRRPSLPWPLLLHRYLLQSGEHSL